MNSRNGSPHSEGSKNFESDIRLHDFRLNRQQQDLNTLQREFQALEASIKQLETYQAKQIGQDKVIGFLVSAIVLSLASIVVSFFFNPKEASSNTSLQSEETFLMSEKSHNLDTTSEL
jgi:hypothetical protein